MELLVIFKNILITKSQWIQKDHLMQLTTNVIVALDKFIQKCDTLQNITLLGLPKNVILYYPYQELVNIINTW
jgi:hypothetical protein